VPSYSQFDEPSTFIWALHAETSLTGRAFVITEASIKAMPNMYDILASHPECNNFDIFI
jgi:hypothetical protein